VLESALVEVARRGESEEQRTGPILARLSMATNPVVKGQLLSILGQIGGEKALVALRAGLADSSPDVKLVALQQLAEWPDDQPMEDLIRIARATQDSQTRSIALRGYVRMIGASESRSPDSALRLYKEAASLAKSTEEKRLVLSGLPKLRSLAALEYAAGFLADEGVRAEAELVVTEIARSTVGAYPDKTKALLSPIGRDSANEEVRKHAQDVLSLIPRFGDFITAWEVSPAYQEDGADHSRLFDAAFAPESPDRAKDVAWRLMPAGTNPDQPWLIDLLAALGGEQRVAYLRTNIWSESPRDLTLELGSDDGIKVWLNGQIVLSNNTARAVAPAQEKVKVHLNAGWNPLLLKVTQNVLGWGACARFTNPDGSPIAGLRFGIPSDAAP